MDQGDLSLVFLATFGQGGSDFGLLFPFPWCLFIKYLDRGHVVSEVVANIGSRFHWLLSIIENVLAMDIDKFLHLGLIVNRERWRSEKLAEFFFFFWELEVSWLVLWFHSFFNFGCNPVSKTSIFWVKINNLH